MATLVARLEAALAFNDVQFEKGIERAEKRSQTFSQRVEKNFIGIFKRDPGQRAENAVSNLIGDITSGNTARGLAQFAGRISSLGIIAGVGIGAAIDIFDKLSDHVKKVQDDSESLRREMLKPMSLIMGLSPEGIDQQAGLLRAKYEKIIEDHKGFAQAFTNVFRDAMDITADFGTSGLRDTRQEQDALDRINQIQRERGRVELELAQARKTTRGDETQSATTELYFKSRQRESAIRLEGGKGAEDRIKALQIDEERLTDEIVRRSEAREEEFKTAEKLLKLQRSSIPEDKKKVLAAAIGLDVVNRSLESPDITTGERRALTLDKLRKENELRGLSKTSRNPFAPGTIANRDFEDEQGGFGTLAGRNKEMNDASVFGSLGYNAAQRGDVPTATQSSLNQQMLTELQSLRALTEKVWATP